MWPPTAHVPMWRRAPAILTRAPPSCPTLTRTNAHPPALPALHHAHHTPVCPPSSSAPPLQVNDLVALRIVIHPNADYEDENEQATLCYHALGKIHGLWTPLPRTLKDYISSPKPNGYRSLHTTVLVGAQPLEIQIRTQEMHLVAEFGAAAHWAYKENGGARASLPWLQLTVRKWRDLDCAHEFMQLVRQARGRTAHERRAHRARSRTHRTRAQPPRAPRAQPPRAHQPRSLPVLRCFP